MQQDSDPEQIYNRTAEKQKNQGWNIHDWISEYRE